MILKSTRVWYQEEFIPLQIEVEGGRITHLYPYELPLAAEDFGTKRILPGLVDIHNHGFDGCDASHATQEWLARWVSYLPSEGVTSLLAATSSVPEAIMLNGMRSIASFMKSPSPGAQILGIYSEGPLISPTFRGAQDINAIVAPTPDIVERYQEACEGNLRYCCIAPEMDEGLAAIRYCVSQGIRVSMGHTGATFAQCAEGREAGAVSFAHTYNAMTPLAHREPGAVGAAMYFADLYAELIGDGIHVSFPAANILGRLKGKDRLILVTDSVQIKGLPPGEYHMPDRHVFLGKDGVGRTPSGNIAGSTAKMNILVANLIEQANLPEATVINAATCNPLQMLGLADHKGYIQVGYDADLAVLEDDYTVARTFVMGEAVY